LSFLRLRKLSAKIYNAHTHGVQSESEDLGLYHLVSQSLEDWHWIIDEVESGRASVGSIAIHPWFTEVADDSHLQTLEQLLIDHPQIQLGETGLDYARPESREIQKQLFEVQMKLAVKLNRIVTIHCVKAWNDCIEILKRTGTPDRGVLFHAFRGSPAIVRELLKYNSYFSFGTRELNRCSFAQIDAVKMIPSERLLVESDRIGSLKIAVDFLANMRDISADSIVMCTNSNFDRFFDKKA